jgi:predicted SAM-dependent methyltransferase
MNRLNIGCSDYPTSGWTNYDISVGLTLAKLGPIPNILNKLRIISDRQLIVVDSYKRNHVKRADVVKKIPEKDSSVDVIYSSHMLEHLDREDAKICVRECFRTLKKDGILRLCIPDLRYKAEEYIETGDADKFIYETYLTIPKPKNILEKLYLFYTGPRHHSWMYDSQSLTKVLLECGFAEVTTLEAGKTTIPNNQVGELDLSQRSDDSFYLEARK